MNRPGLTVGPPSRLSPGVSHKAGGYAIRRHHARCLEPQPRRLRDRGGNGRRRGPAVDWPLERPTAHSIIRWYTRPSSV
jgi:hypothetical protein